ncbi:MAG: hypothetical protein COV66_03865 [Nitrospinae bacterium CG11_big_fil_rev_8_21_14_0_20_45_15]|nr:MAG: hypothetical protein COV66_03865 [Nitrospinae bacterium CG11_big_fil_rev_8_21_14_0_20_45_15]
MIFSGTRSNNDPLLEIHNLQLFKTYIFKTLISLSMLSVLFLFCDHAVAQQAADPQKGDEEEFLNQGLISTSKTYKITLQSQYIVFKIQNNAGKTINNIYPWIYKFFKDPKDGIDKYLLVNNVHRGGIMLNGIPHRPGTRVDWRFSLVRGNKPNGPEAKNYILLTHPKSIYFNNIEPPPDPLQK